MHQAMPVGALKSVRVARLSFREKKCVLQKLRPAQRYSEFYGRKGEVDLDDPLLYHRLIEAEKFAYAQRAKLGDPAYVPEALQLAQNMTRSSYSKLIMSLIKETSQPLEAYTDTLLHLPDDHGTSHVSAIDKDSNAVACTSTINQIFGSMRISPTLGIVWNDEMDDFSIPGTSNAFGIAPSPANYIEPGKRPMSTTAQAVIRMLLFNQTVKEAIDAPRLHNQFLPPVTLYESSFPEEIIANLTNAREQNMTSTEKLKCVVQALLVGDDDYIYGNSDFRRQTSTYPSGF
ncbi:unnamed protein product [Gongylonema pulchrum]|uniref:Amidase domain-containing protein n=1 Tax=Gongylonema pulchrum TaxID=637853 RepID=A0A183CUB6_9BILA|nr:unnamed protein product [Gongylonema pulchrum]